MTRDAVSAAFDIKNVKLTIQECLVDIPQVYKEGRPVEEALQRIKDVGGIFAVSPDRGYWVPSVKADIPRCHRPRVFSFLPST